MNNPIVRLVELRKHFENGAIKALDGVTFDIARGEFVAIVGPSGSGKTTLLNMIGALDYPTSGQVILNGTELNPQVNLDLVRAREIGFVFQLHNLIPTLTAVENVEIPMMALHTPRPQRKTRAEELLKRVGLGHRRHSNAVKLSGGERQRVAIARALANRPSILLGDEPTGNLDSKTGEEILRILLDLKREEGLTLIIVTHNPELAAAADRVLEIRDGKLAADKSRVVG